MTQIGFYVLQGGDEQELLVLACRLAEKAYQRRYRVYIHAPDEPLQQRLQDQLWTFSQGSFVPHDLATEDASAPVLIGAGEPPAGMDGVLINLATDVPDFFSRFERLIELVATNGAHRKQARERYRFYQDRGYALETHEVQPG